MKEHCFIPTPSELLAIRDGRMRAFRSILKPQPQCVPHEYEGGTGYRLKVEGTNQTPKPKYKVGDILWVKETWLPLMFNKHTDKQSYLYKADNPDRFVHRLDEDDKWRASIQMPRDAARCFLVITGVRVACLRDMTIADAQAEGIIDLTYSPGNAPVRDYPWEAVASAVCAKYGHDFDSWFFVYEFELLDSES